MNGKLWAIVAISLVVGANGALGLTFQNGTATFSQTCGTGGPFNPDGSADGNPSNAGWSISTNCTPGNNTSDQTAVWETVEDIDAVRLKFRVRQNWNSPGQHLLGRFRLSITTDDRSTFADGLDSGGDVTANWTVLTTPQVSSVPGMTFTVQPDNSILVGGTIPNTATYEIDYNGSFSGVTGVRLEVMEHPSLPFNGPGTQPAAGNLVLTELEMQPYLDVPASGPWTSSLLILVLSVGAVFALRRRVPQA